MQYSNQQMCASNSERSSRRSVALAVSHPTDADRILVVQCPNYPNEDFPGVWGLPASTLQPHERIKSAINRIATQKLGMHLINLREIAKGIEQNETGHHEMTIFAAETSDSWPAMPKWRLGSSTLYTDWRWGSPKCLEEGISKGSLCCRLYADSVTHQSSGKLLKHANPEHILVRFHEIALKGDNRPWFIERLVQNIRRSTRNLGVKDVRKGQLIIMLTLEPDANWQAIKVRLTHVFGIAKFSPAHLVPKSMADIKEKTQQLLQREDFSSFRIAARRADKSFPLTSLEINRELGSFVEELSGARVDLTKPDFSLFVDILPHGAYIYTEECPGPGGLPVGVSGRVLSLLSGGIDSPVAAWHMLKRGCPVDFIHFHAFPLVDGTSREKAHELAELLNRHQSSTRLFLVPFAEAQKTIILNVPPAYRILVYRRFMLRIAQQIAQQNNIQVLATGESIGQVGSQTIENLTTIRSVITLPVLSPLIGMDKQDIVNKARLLETYPISIIPDQDCCTLFVPRHPRTRSTSNELDNVESTLNITTIVEETVRATEVLHLNAIAPSFQAT